ncbi:MAG: MarR family transcriptional regulator [Armatimonadetes bacterium]|nr:MarR family transcriptional regulator [Armatimonadota bacterium]
MSDVLKEAERLEELLPLALRALFPGVEDEPLGDIPLSQMRVMRLLFARPRSSTELSTELGVSLPAVTQLVTKLEASGLVERTCSSSDKRCKTVGLSAEGREQMSARRRSRSDRAARVLGTMDPAVRRSLVEALERVVAPGQD